MRRISAWIAGLFSFLAAATAFAQEHAAAADGGNAFGLKTALALSAGLCIGIASFGGALGQGRAASAALEGIARNPEAASKVMTPMIIALALIESLVIYSLVIAFLLQGKI
ncbi:MAG: ATP synthase F0 subunit C [Pseudomonadota bacterium]